MMLIDEITNLISILPEQDVTIAFNFIKNRQFEKLKELVDSDVVKLQHQALNYEINTNEYYVALSNLDNCLQLQQNVNRYLDQLGILYDDIDEDDYDLFDNEYDEDEYYDHLWYMYNVNNI